MSNTWYTVYGEDETAEKAAQERLLAAWPDAPIQNLELCENILETARDQVIAYAPAPAPTQPGEPVPAPPARYVLAQLQQARNLWNAGRAAGDGDIGPEGFTFRPFPLDRVIKAVIRPTDGKLHVL